MDKGLGNNVNEIKRVAYNLNAKHVNDDIVSNCPIYLEPLVNKVDDRTLVKLRCDH